jgi:hypothetical protein
MSGLKNPLLFHNTILFFSPVHTPCGGLYFLLFQVFASSIFCGCFFFPRSIHDMHSTKESEGVKSTSITKPLEQLISLFCA